MGTHHIFLGDPHHSQEGGPRRGALLDAIALGWFCHGV
jgi:hypothetical protein